MRLWTDGHPEQISAGPGGVPWVVQDNAVIQPE